jgi:hypothetical protein
MLFIYESRLHYRSWWATQSRIYIPRLPITLAGPPSTKSIAKVKILALSIFRKYIKYRQPTTRSRCLDQGTFLPRHAGVACGAVLLARTPGAGRLSWNTPKDIYPGPPGAPKPRLPSFLPPRTTWAPSSIGHGRIARKWPPCDDGGCGGWPGISAQALGCTLLPAGRSACSPRPTVHSSFVFLCPMARRPNTYACARMDQRTGYRRPASAPFSTFPSNSGTVVHIPYPLPRLGCGPCISIALSPARCMDVFSLPANTELRQRHPREPLLTIFRKHGCTMIEAF